MIEPRSSTNKQNILGKLNMNIEQQLKSLRLSNFSISDLDYSTTAASARADIWFRDLRYLGAGADRKGLGSATFFLVRK